MVHNEHFAKTLRRLRTERLWTQDDLVDKIGVGSGATISKWESGRSLPRKETIAKICELFGVSVGELLGIPDNQTRPAAEDGRTENGPEHRGSLNKLPMSANAISPTRDAAEEGNCISFTLANSKLEPYYLPGDQLVVKTDAPNMSGACLLVDRDLSNLPFVAEVLEAGDNNVTFSIIDQKPRVLSKSNVEIIGKVVELRRYNF